MLSSGAGRAAVALGISLLCGACQTPQANVEPLPPNMPGMAMPYDMPGTYPNGMPIVCGPDGQPTPLPYQAWQGSAWSPPGVLKPWPRDEYLHDGGDEHLPVAVSPEWRVYGLELEDTVAHYDAMDGRTLVEASNCVYLYAPRFGAVRQVTSLVANDQLVGPSDVIRPEAPVGHALALAPNTSLQRQQVDGHVDARMPAAYRLKVGDGALSLALGPLAFQDGFLPFENLEVIRSGRYDAQEKARLAEFAQAAVTWTGDQQVQVVIDGVAAQATTGVEQAMVMYTVEDDRQPRLCLIKVASTGTAKPGDTVDFTLRFDNIGEQILGNIVLLDNLTTRLEYVEGSAQASKEARFATEPNEGGSVRLRWEITEPLQPGDGGIVRFQCRVR